MCHVTKNTAPAKRVHAVLPEDDFILCKTGNFLEIKHAFGVDAIGVYGYRML
jgi:hypothetical protein